MRDDLGRKRLVGLSLVLRYPSQCVEALGQGANQHFEVLFEAFERGSPDLSLPLMAELIEDRLALSQHVKAECGDPKMLATGIDRVWVACHIAACLQHRDCFGCCLF